MSVLIREGLTALFDEIAEKDVKYLRLEFSKIYEKIYKRYEHVFSEMVREIEEAEDSELKATEIAAYIPDHVEQKFGDKLSKRKKEVILVDYNMKVVIYILPLLNQNNTEAGKSVSEKLVKIWNERFGTSIGNTGYEQIATGFKQRLCYITTAVCESLQKPDDCYELETLRAYRDQYLLAECHEDALVEEYYCVAPLIVEAINHQADSVQIYKGILEEYIQPCIRLIESEQKEACKELYKEMVHTLQNKYLHA